MYQQKRSLLYVIIVLVIAAFLFFYKKDKPQVLDISSVSTSELTQDYHPKTTEIIPSDDVSYLSSESVVIAYVKENGKLPAYYITKSAAKKKGWIARKGNLCEVLHGKVIGGDYFGNFEGKLPKQKGRKYYEADLNYHCKGRNSDRLIFSNDHLIFVTYDHYKTFEKR